MLPRIATLTLIAGLLAACGTATIDTTETVAQSVAPVATASGGQIDLNSLAGTDIVLWFWAPW